VAADLLLDTGAFVALVDCDEKLHDDCVAALEQWTGPVVTTEVVLTETLYLVGPGWRAQKACLEFILRGAVSVGAFVGEKSSARRGPDGKVSQRPDGFR
jgi:predicted nucleic acid-binding protein